MIILQHVDNAFWTLSYGQKELDALEAVHGSEWRVRRVANTERDLEIMFPDKFKYPATLFIYVPKKKGRPFKGDSHYKKTF